MSVRVYCRVRIFAFVIDCPLCLHVSPPPHITSVIPIRTWHRQQAHSTAQHRVIGYTQVTLGGIKSLVVPNHGPLFSSFCPLHMFRCIVPCASVAGGCGALAHTHTLYSKVMFCRVGEFRVRVWGSYITSRSFGYGYGSVIEFTEVPGIAAPEYGTHRSSGRAQKVLYPYPRYYKN